MPTSRRTSTLPLSIRRIFDDRTTVIIIGRPSGTATTTTVTASVTACRSFESSTAGEESIARMATVRKPFARTTEQKRSASPTTAAPT